MKLESISGTAHCAANSPHSTKQIEQQKCVYTLALAAALTLAVFAPPSTQAQTFTLLHAFSGYPVDGAGPNAGLIPDAEGNLYSTTYLGGVSNNGTVFKITKSGEETMLYSFEGGLDGDGIDAGLVMDAKGNLYGTAAFGGTGCWRFGCGTVFKVSTSGNETVLYRFEGRPNGEAPISSLILDAKGNLYGTTAVGGGNRCSQDGCGTVFKVSKSGNETVLHSFGEAEDGRYPYAGLVMDATGNLYGTSAGGGKYGTGTVFKVNNKGEETVLYSFGNLEDGQDPWGGLVMDANGNLYGTTRLGGKYGKGTVFKVNNNGKETVLYSFGPLPDGALPVAGLIMDAKGNLYGTTPDGGAGCNYGCGTVFKVSLSGKETVLYSFCQVSGCPDGANPGASLVMDATGNLYGTTITGGTNMGGTVFKLTP